MVGASQLLEPVAVCPVNWDFSGFQVDLVIPSYQVEPKLILWPGCLVGWRNHRNQFCFLFLSIYCNSSKGGSVIVGSLISKWLVSSLLKAAPLF